MDPALVDSNWASRDEPPSAATVASESYTMVEIVSPEHDTELV